MNTTYELSRFNNYYFIQSLSHIFHYTSSIFFSLDIFLLNCGCVCVFSVMSNSLWPMDCSPLGSSVHGIFQARILEPVSISYIRASSQPRDRTASLAPPELAGRFFTTSATWRYFNLKIWICPLKKHVPVLSHIWSHSQVLGARTPTYLFISDTYVFIISNTAAHSKIYAYYSASDKHSWVRVCNSSTRKTKTDTTCNL